MLETRKKICIGGAGGFAREAFVCLLDSIDELRGPAVDLFRFMVEEEYLNDQQEVMDIPVIPFSDFDQEQHIALMAISDPQTRHRIVESLPEDTDFHTLFHPTVVSSQWVTIGEGSIVTAGCVLTVNIDLGMHSHLNLNTTVGHDCRIGNFFTSAPGVNISGNCTIGHRVFVGTNAAIREGIAICDDVTIGMGAVVLNDITEPGTYVGCPAKKLR